jgi:hypothetical protein
MKVKNENWKKFDVFNDFVNSGNIKLQQSRLIPLLKTGDEQALTSIFLSSLRLVKEFRNKIFSDVKLKRSGKIFYFTEVCFKDIDSHSYFDGLILVVSGGRIVDSAIVEVKNDKNKIDEDQILKYYNIAKAIGISKIITISNQFVADPSHSVVNIKNQSKKINLFHLSWTYIQTVGQLLLFDNDDNISDEDQVEIMNEVLHYMSDARSGVNGFHQMSDGWSKVSEKIRNSITLSKNDDKDIEEAVVSWHQEEIDMKLMLTRNLGIVVKSVNEDPRKKLKTKNHLTTSLKIKGAVSDIDVKAEFERRMLQMSVEVTPPLDKGTISRLTWVKKQLEKIDSPLLNDISVHASVKYSSKPLTEKFADFDRFYDYDDIKKKDITQFTLTLNNGIAASFKSKKKFVTLIEAMLRDFYKDIVQNIKTWQAPPPKLKEIKKEVVEKDIKEVK